MKKRAEETIKEIVLSRTRTRTKKKKGEDMRLIQALDDSSTRLVLQEFHCCRIDVRNGTI